MNSSSLSKLGSDDLGQDRRRATHSGVGPRRPIGVSPMVVLATVALLGTGGLTNATETKPDMETSKFEIRAAPEEGISGKDWTLEEGSQPAFRITKSAPPARSIRGLEKDDEPKKAREEVVRAKAAMKSARMRTGRVVRRVVRRRPVRRVVRRRPVRRTVVNRRYTSIYARRNARYVIRKKIYRHFRLGYATSQTPPGVKPKFVTYGKPKTGQNAHWVQGPERFTNFGVFTWPHGKVSIQKIRLVGNTSGNTLAVHCIRRYYNLLQTMRSQIETYELGSRCHLGIQYALRDWNSRAPGTHFYTNGW